MGLENSTETVKRCQTAGVLKVASSMHVLAAICTGGGW